MIVEWGLGSITPYDFIRLVPGTWYRSKAYTSTGISEFIFGYRLRTSNRARGTSPLISHKIITTAIAQHHQDEFHPTHLGVFVVIANGS